MLQDRFLKFVNARPDLNKQLTSFALYNASYDIVLESKFVKNLVFNEFKQTIFDLLDINFAKEYRASSFFNVDELITLCDSNFKSITSSSLLEIVARFDDTLFTDTRHLDLDSIVYIVNHAGDLKLFSDVGVSRYIHCYNNSNEVGCSVVLWFYQPGYPHYESEFNYEFSTSDSYNDILETLESAFDKLCEDEYRYGKVDK